MATASFSQNLMALQNNMLSFAYMLTNNRDDAYDLLQDTTLRALDCQEEYAESTNFKGWIFAIMRSIFASNYRHAEDSQVSIGCQDTLYTLNLSQEEGTALPEGSISADMITAAIREFEDDYRIPFSMHVAGYKHDEIARETGLALSTIKSRIIFASHKLRSRLSI